ncbi:MAG TPA: sugar phosphate isomerase/epimerase family protein [Ktedonobacteraceae bacterium]|jgi:sugar phosphate isomerase/epimerase|nr:sugar phosphate isomerase/epimerase family protein [Ktedonobacteraceae bacterium]
MRFSIITDEIAQDLERALRVCRELGVSTVELRSIDGQNIVFHDESSLQRIRALLIEGGFRVGVIASPFLKSHFWGKYPYARAEQPVSDFDTQERQWEILERSFALARFFDTRLVRTFSFWRLAHPDLVRDELLAILSEAVERTEKAGLKLVLENEHACILATGAEVDWFLQRIPSQAFGVIWDPGNEAFAGSRPFPDGYRHVRGRVAHVHLKDVDGGQRRFVKMGTGIIDYAGQLRALAEDGYDGLLSLETHYKHPEGGAEQATRESFAALRMLAGRAGVDIA